MSSIETSPTCWFVGASFGDGTEDQLPRFLSQGIWENGYEDRFLEEVRSMRVGDRIVAKSAYTRKHNLPFDNDGKTVSVMAIKAIGVITANANNGRHVSVQWQKLESPREWYFFTHRQTIWRAKPGNWMTDALIAFAIDGAPQDIGRFLKEPYWRSRYASDSAKTRFAWTAFFEEIAEKLLPYQNDRSALVSGIHQIAANNQLTYLEDRFPDGSNGPLQDICPFTAMGIFNRGMTNANRSRIAHELANFLGVTATVPSTFDGVPILNNQSSWFFGYADRRDASDIDELWNVFAASHAFVGSDSSDRRDTFAAAYDRALQNFGIKWNLSTGLYWAHPWDFPTLDSNSRTYLDTILGLPVATSARSPAIGGAEYVALVDSLKSRFLEPTYPVHSFPELSLTAWQPQSVTISRSDEPLSETFPDAPEMSPNMTHFSAPDLYTVDDLLREGCFLDRSELERILSRLRDKKNLILQGPPGTGKSWLAKRVAFALIGRRDNSRVRAVQFHPNLSYEDFVRGWRPTGEGKLSLSDGVFMEAIRAALASPASTFVVVIEEINRGNPAQIFGEMLTLLEAGKRSPSEALELCYPDSDGVRRPVHIPENLYVVGTMNVADRSLALVDLALRRRFAFFDLAPSLSAEWRKWVVSNCNVDLARVDQISERVTTLNKQISTDARLGKQFCIGHSYVTPTRPLEPGETLRWFTEVVHTELAPLLDEYWFDEPQTAASATARLLAGW